LREHPDGENLSREKFDDDLRLLEKPLCGFGEFNILYEDLQQF
jgi:hypothetical protein